MLKLMFFPSLQKLYVKYMIGARGEGKRGRLTEFSKQLHTQGSVDEKQEHEKQAKVSYLRGKKVKPSSGQAELPEVCFWKGSLAFLSMGHTEFPVRSSRQQSPLPTGLWLKKCGVQLHQPTS